MTRRNFPRRLSFSQVAVFMIASTINYFELKHKKRFVRQTIDIQMIFGKRFFDTVYTVFTLHIVG